jgi:hypothetical protein
MLGTTSLTRRGRGLIVIIRKEDGMEQETEEVGQGDEWFALPWDDEDYEVDPEREWERFTWLEDLLVPLDSVSKSD